MTRFLLAASGVLACSVLGAIACENPEPRLAGSPSGAREPQWQDALPAAPKLLVFLRPKALRDDRVYGPMLRRALELARERRVTSGSLVLDAIEDADQAIAELGDLAPEDNQAPQELVVVLRGVRSDIDPATLVGPEGDLLWSPGPTGAVRELVHEVDRDGTPNPASLFELPGRTWVVASGLARDRAREAFAHPSRRREPVSALDALATIWIDGPSLVERVSQLRPSGLLASVGNGLKSLALDLLAPTAAPGGPPGSNPIPSRDVRAVASYPQDQAAADAGEAFGEMLEVVSRLKPAGLAWLAPAKVVVEGSRVIVTEPLPLALLAGLLEAGRPPPPTP